MFHYLYFSLSYDTKSLTAIATKHFKAASGQQLVFAPGEIYKEVKIGIINMDNIIEGNKTFKVIFSSPQSSVTLTGSKHVNITIMYTKGRQSHIVVTEHCNSSLLFRVTLLNFTQNDSINEVN